MAKKAAASVLIVGSECAPFAKTGGLADVIGTLPRDLTALGLDVRVMIPFHSIIKKKYGGKTAHLVDFWIHLGWRSQYVGIESLVADGVTYYFVDNEYYFGGPIYKGGEAEGEPSTPFSSAQCLRHCQKSALFRTSSMQTTGRPAWCRCSSKRSIKKPN